MRTSKTAIQQRTKTNNDRIPRMRNVKETNLLAYKKTVGIFWVWDRAFGTGYGLDDRGIVVLLPADPRGCSHLERTDRSRAHPAFYSLGNDGRHGREADDRPLSSVSSPIRLHSIHKGKSAWKCNGYTLC